MSAKEPNSVHSPSYMSNTPMPKPTPPPPFKDSVGVCPNSIINTEAQNLEAAWKAFVQTLPVGAQINIESAKDRDESITYKSFIAGFNASNGIVHGRR